jgi:predicted HTH transcriptional regulator
MTPQELLESLLEGGTEGLRVDFKVSMPWSAKSFAKDFMAFANTEDGGHLIIGVQDEPFERIGMTAAHAATYKSDKMHDQMTQFVDPYVDFTTHMVQADDSKTYVLIRIEPFEEIPVICKIEHQQEKLSAGRLYIRTRTRRPESAPVKTQSEMRDLIERASFRMMKRFQRLGLVTGEQQSGASDQRLLESELQGL